jgi:hypothetical protein
MSLALSPENFQPMRTPNVRGAASQ